MNLGIDFEFDVGDVEQHHVQFRWGQVFGLAQIWVDGAEVLRERHIFGFDTTRSYQVLVGTDEVHSVRIEKVRPQYLSGFRKQGCRAFVDGRFIGDY